MVLDRRPIDFAGLAAALLRQVDALVLRWLPNGIERNGRWYVGDFDGAPGDSANVNMSTGQWIDNAAPDEDKGGDLISLYARIHGLNNGQAARRLMQEMGWAPIDDRPAARPDSGMPPPWVDEVIGTPAPATVSPPAAQPALAAQAKRRSMWRAVTPVPPMAPKPSFSWGYHDKRMDVWHEIEAVRTWCYEFNGQRFGYVARFERCSSDGELVKDTLPRTWCVDESDDRGSMQWRWKAWDVPRPLYVPAARLSANGLLPIVVVEGEKCAEAGFKLLGHEFDFISWPGGCKTWALAAWAWITGRTVYLWPDCDAKRKGLSKAEREAGIDPATKLLLPEALQPGMAAMVGIGSMLMAKLDCQVFMCPIPAPGAVGDGWDIADAIAQGWDADQVRDFIRSARVFVPPDEAVRAATGNLQTRSMAGAGSGDGGSGGAGGGGDGGVGAADGMQGAQPWRRHLLLSGTGSVKAVRENVVLALDGWPDKQVPGVPDAAGLIAFNEFTNNVEKRRAAPWGTPTGVWEEVDELLMGQWLVQEHGLPSMARGSLEEAVLMAGRRHAYHPVRERMLALRGKWDGVPRLETWLRRCCLEEDEFDDSDPLQRYLALAGKWFLMAMVCRVLPLVKEGTRTVRGPGTKFDYMLIFESPQGWGKSTMASILGGEHFADTGLMIGDKDSFQNIQGVLVYEWGELENMSRQEVSKVKLFVSSPKDRFRASFDRRPRDYPRQVVFVGTTNESHYLTDTTGNRRFWPVRMECPPDQVWLTEHLPQMIAEALHCLDAGERFWPTREEQRLLFDPQQQARTVESSIESAIRHYLYEEEQKVPHGSQNGSLRNEIALGELMACIGYSIDKQTDVVSKKVSAVMHMLGWSVRRTSQPGRPRVYVRPNTSSAPPIKAGGSGGSMRDGAANETPATDESLEGHDDCPF